MKISSTSISHAETSSAPALAGPVFTSLAFFLVLVALRFTEIVVPGLDTLPDKNIFSRILAFLLVLGYLWAQRESVSSIGLHSRHFGKAFLIGGLSLILMYVTLYSIQFYRLSSAGETSRLVFAVINKASGTNYGLYFTLFNVLGQIVNAFVEESLFRGVMLPQLMQRFKFSQANMLQALLFGLAHLALAGPLSNWLSGQATAGEVLSEAAFLLLATIIGGLVFGYLYYRTDSLWTAIFAHLIDNCAVKFFHIQTATRLSAETDILMLASVGFISLVILAWVIAKRANLPTLEPEQTN
jgi:membrane protease YdiL (CAAX protease family)